MGEVECGMRRTRERILERFRLGRVVGSQPAIWVRKMVRVDREEEAIYDRQRKALRIYLFGPDQNLLAS